METEKEYEVVVEKNVCVKKLLELETDKKQIDIFVSLISGFTIFCLPTTIIFTFLGVSFGINVTESILMSLLLYPITLLLLLDGIPFYNFFKSSLIKFKFFKKKENTYQNYEKKVGELLSNENFQMSYLAAIDGKIKHLEINYNIEDPTIKMHIEYLMREKNQLKSLFIDNQYEILYLSNKIHEINCYMKNMNVPNYSKSHVEIFDKKYNDFLKQNNLNELAIEKKENITDYTKII